MNSNKNPSSRSRSLQALIAGAATALFVVALLALRICLENPFFMDRPGLFTLGFGLPAAVIVGVLSLVLRRWTGRIPLGLTGPLLILGLVAPWGLQRWPRPAPLQGVKLVVFGLDGATFNIIDKHREILPNLSALERRGARGDLRSMEPMFSPLLWTTMGTGQIPEKHGIHGFRTRSTDCRVPRFWDIMEEKGLRTGIYKWLVTYPPDHLSAFMVPAWLAPAPDTWPEDLSFIKEIELSRRQKRKKVESRRSAPVLLLDGVTRGLRVGTVAKAAFFSFSERFIRPSPERSIRGGQLLRVLMDRDVFIWAMHRHPAEVLSFSDYATDALGHRFWKFHEPERFPEVSPAEVERWGSTLIDAYRQGDAVLGEIVANAGPEARVVVVSDHGFRAMEASDEGRYFVPTTRRLQERLTERLGKVEVARMGHKLVLTLPSSESQPVQALAELRSFLDELVDESGQPFYRAEPVEGVGFALGLTLVNESVPEARLERGSVGGEPITDYVARTESYSGEHDALGVFLAAGPGITAGARLPEMGLLDVAPVLLAMVDIPKAADMVGELPEGLFLAAPELGELPASYEGLNARRRVEGGSEGVNEEQLRALGYIE